MAQIKVVINVLFLSVFCCPNFLSAAKFTDFNGETPSKKFSDSSPNRIIPVFNADVDGKGNFQFKKWVPHGNINKAKRIFRNFNLKKPFMKHGQVVEDKKLNYINLNRTLSRSDLMSAKDITDTVVELIIICDKEFGDLFDHDNQMILDYWTVYMWDLNLRYKTLPNSQISFRINGIIVISSFAAQPFIEKARAPDGRAEFSRILGRYSTWLYSQRNTLPKHDLAPLVTHTALEWEGGLGILNGACWVDTRTWRDLGISVFNDGGYWASVTTAAAQLAHNLGAPSDDEPNFPGICTQRGFIMNGGNEDRRYYFSSCSDRMISQFIASDSASCLQQINESNGPALDPSYSSPKSPSLQEICSLGLNSNAAYIDEADTTNCKSIKCFMANDAGIQVFNITPVENAICSGDGMRCFRGVCRQQGYMFRNEASGLCLAASESFEYYNLAQMVECPADGTPLDRFLLVTGVDGGMDLEAPFTYHDNEENGNKCLWSGVPVSGGNIGSVWTDLCNTDNPWQGWDFQDIGDGRFMMFHIVTERCAIPESRDVGSYILTVGPCDPNNPDMIWTKNL